MSNDFAIQSVQESAQNYGPVDWGSPGKKKKKYNYVITLEDDEFVNGTRI